MAPVVGSDDGTQYHKDFTLSITKALGDQLAKALEKLDRAPSPRRIWRDSRRNLGSTSST